jgi:hypothetical protein
MAMRIWNDRGVSAGIRGQGAFALEKLGVEEPRDQVGLQRLEPPERLAGAEGQRRRGPVAAPRQAEDARGKGRRDVGLASIARQARSPWPSGG